MTREQKMEELLVPITWNWSSSVRSRQILVDERHREVSTAMPFMTPSEKSKAKMWQEKERRSDLWA